MTALTYILPIRATAAPSPELTRYLDFIGRHYPLIVVDGSDPTVYALNHAAWSPLGLHISPSATLHCRNGKVRGVLTALPLVSTAGLVIADDDVRYSLDGLLDAASALRRGDVVVPQNYFRPLPWHARWDTARILLNRVTGGDFPGTLIVRTAALRATNGYDGDALFENLELMRTVEAAGGTVVRRPDLFVRRRPPTATHFFGQRVRQAYDEFARPWRLVATLGVVPLTLVAMRRRRLISVAATAAATVAAAEIGRRRDDGRRWFPWTSTLLAPLWMLERGVCSWLAVVARARGGVRYGESRLQLAAHRPGQLRTALEDSRSLQTVGSREPERVRNRWVSAWQAARPPTAGRARGPFDPIGQHKVE